MTYNDRNITDALWISYTPNDGYSATGFDNQGNGNSCFGKQTFNVQTNNNVIYQSVESNTCDNVHYEDCYLKSAGAKYPHGVEVTSMGLQYQLNWTPPNSTSTSYYYYLW